MSGYLEIRVTGVTAAVWLFWQGVFDESYQFQL